MSPSSWFKVTKSILVDFGFLQSQFLSHRPRVKPGSKETKEPTMSNIFILNGAQPYDFAPGTLNAALTDRARTLLATQGHPVRVTTVAEGYDVDAEIENHIWADTVIMQFAVNWMGVPWSFKKYMDEVYTAGMDGRLTKGDGRRAEAPKKNYGMGGALTGARYMLSVTLNAPREAFDDRSDPFFRGDSLDDLLQPMHLNARFFGMTPLPSFAAYDVMKAPEIEADFARFDAQLKAVIAAAEHLSILAQCQTVRHSFKVSRKRPSDVISGPAFCQYYIRERLAECLPPVIGTDRSSGSSGPK